MIHIGIWLFFAHTAEANTLAKTSPASSTIKHSTAQNNASISSTTSHAELMAQAAQKKTCDFKPDERWLQANSCPQLFGNSAQHQDIKRWQKTAVQSIEQDKYCIDLVHSKNWKDPKRVKLKGFELIKIERHKNCPSMALIQVDANSLGANCPSGLYAVSGDSAIGQNGRVVAIIGDILLIELQGQLSYLSTSPGQQPVWRLTWRSPWQISTPQASSSSRGKTGRRKAKARKPARHKAVKRRRAKRK